MVTENSGLRSLLITYSVRNYDSYGIRAIVPRALTLNPPFSSAIHHYQVQVPSNVEDLNLCTPHVPDARVEVSGNTGLQFGINTVKLMVTNLVTNERVDYIVNVDRKRERGFLSKIATYGTLASALIVGAVVLTQRTSRTRRPKSERPQSSLYWRPKISSMMDEIMRPFC